MLTSEKRKTDGSIRDRSPSLRGGPAPIRSALFDVVTEAPRASRPAEADWLDVRNEIGAHGYGVESRGVALTNVVDLMTFMFTDMEGSARMIEKMGDREAHEVFKTHDDIIRGLLASFGAREVGQHGDGFSLAFESAWLAVSCAVAVQRAFAAHGRAYPRDRIHVRIGVHTGPAIRAGRGFFGKSVVVAARITAEAKGGEILGSEPVLEAARAVASGIVSGEPRAVELKGLSGTYVLHPIDWAQARGRVITPVKG